MPFPEASKLISGDCVLALADNHVSPEFAIRESTNANCKSSNRPMREIQPLRVWFALHVDSTLSPSVLFSRVQTPTY